MNALGDTATRVLLCTIAQDRPTVRSVAADVGKSVMATHAQLCKLRAAGLVMWEDGKAGTLRAMVAAVRTPVHYDGGTAHRSGAGDALSRTPAPWAARSHLKEGHRA